MKKDKDQQYWKEISTEELEIGLKKFLKCKSPGIDKIPKCFLRRTLQTGIITILHCWNPGRVPKWLPEGVAYFLLKTAGTKNPKICRRITCLSTAYNIFAPIFTERMYTFIKTKEAFPLKQKGCKRGSYHC